MKNIADVNSDDILTELNNLDYNDSDDLMLLDDEDIKPIGSKSNDDLSDFYLNYDKKTSNEVDLFSERPKINVDRPLDKYMEVPKVEKKTEEKKSNIPEEKVVPTNIDSYLNRDQKNINKPSSNTYTENIRSYNQPVSENKKINNDSQTKPIRQPDRSLNANDLNQLFSKVSNNVKGASEIVNRNAEIKRKIDERFDELRRLQQQHETNKQKDIAEINAYKDEVYSKLQQKKLDMEKDIKELRSAQEKLEKEKKEFEAYKATSLANLNKLEKELKESYDNRSKNIEQVEIGLVKRKEQLDIERASIVKEKEELADNLMKFNKLVSDFTQGIEPF